MRQQRYIRWALLLTCLVLVFPFSTTSVPAKTVLVISRDSKPVQGAKIRQSWQNYSIEETGHEEDLFTGEDGRVFFPPRTVRASLLRRAYGPLLNVLTQGVHASFGVHTYILYLNGDTERLSSSTTAPRPGEIVFFKP